MERHLLRCFLYICFAFISRSYSKVRSCQRYCHTFFPEFPLRAVELIRPSDAIAGGFNCDRLKERRIAQYLKFGTFIYEYRHVEYFDHIILKENEKTQIVERYDLCDFDRQHGHHLLSITG